jgi:glycosyltransferase involved in cell wall biosynthesis
MPGMSGRAFIHVGSPKTGTTFLQAVIWRSRDQLETDGVRLPGPSLHKTFQAALDVRGTLQRARFPDEAEGAWRRLLTGLRDWPNDVLISHELLASAPQDRAHAAVADLAELGYEPHIVLTARDLARQLPAEWQERIKHRSTIGFDRFMAGAQDPESRVYRHLWSLQDYADVLRRWADGLPPDQVHLVTVPPAGAPRGVLWERFADAIGVDPAAYSLDVRRDNTSLGHEQTVLLQHVNRRLRDRVPMPGTYSDVGKALLAQQVLSARAGAPLVLGGDDLAFARRRSAEVVEALRERGVTLHGELTDLLVPEGGPATSSGRELVNDEVLLEESLEAMADLLDATAERFEAGRVQRTRLRAELQRARGELRISRQRVAELEQRFHLLRVGARRLRTKARAVSSRVGQVRSGRRPRVYFFVFNGDGSGGVARTTLTVANALAGRYDVEVLSVYRARGKPTFELDPRVKLTYLVPAKPWPNSPYPRHLRRLAAQPSVLETTDNYTAASDAAITGALSELRDGDVLISTRPSLHPASLVLAPDKHLIRIGWDHLNFPARYAGGGRPGRSIDRAVPGLDALVVLTEADAADYRNRHPAARVEVIRNAVPWPPATVRAPRDEKVVMAAGRLSEEKGYERLIEAWALLQDEFPDWTCRIYGKGHLKGALHAQIEASGAAVDLAGYTEDVRGALAGSAVFAMSSRVEGFPMSLIEALAEGTPLVSFDCPRGPGEIVVDGSNGLLVPEGDVGGLAKALAALMRDRELRDRMGEQAMADAQSYDISKIAQDWIDLIEALIRERRG